MNERRLYIGMIQTGEPGEFAALDVCVGAFVHLQPAIEAVQRDLREVHNNSKFITGLEWVPPLDTESDCYALMNVREDETFATVTQVLVDRRAHRDPSLSRRAFKAEA